MVAKRWSIDEAERHLRDVLDQARDDGPQEVTSEGETFVIVPASAWRERAGEVVGVSDSADRGDFSRSLDQIHNELNETTPRDLFAWVDEMTEEEVDAWEQRLDDARQRRSEASRTSDQ